mmetsp:Transcript_22824/g.53339  ORF Transcript_22824/g.53339 Transcript_22824/m.53339 type:complete len:484 (-) Transcript_22824:85-1536(-)
MPGPPVLRTILDPDLFIDPDFPHKHSSIGKELDADCRMRWIPARRLSEKILASDWHLFDGIEPNDLLMGSVGDSNFLAAIAVLAEFPSVVRNLFVKNSHKDLQKLPRDGTYVLRLYDHSRKGFRDLLVDEYVPYHPETGRFFFAQPHGNELWVLMLEKAMAKLLGNYSALAHVNCGTAFRALTGETDQRHWQRRGKEWSESKLKEGETSFPVETSLQVKEGEAFFEVLKEYHSKNYLMCAQANQAENGNDGKERKDGLVDGHCYSLHMVVEVDGYKLLKMRNPWGTDKEWSGEWSDGDNMWNKHPSVRKQLRPVFGPDGIFWMDWNNFSRLFQGVFVSCKTMQGRAGEGSAEGAMSKRMTAEEEKAVAEKQVRQLFLTSDLNKDGKLNVEELAVLMQELGMDGAQARKLLKIADKDCDGRLDPQEFLDWIFTGKTKNAAEAKRSVLERGLEQERLEAEAAAKAAAEAASKNGKKPGKDKKASK